MTDERFWLPLARSTGRFKEGFDVHRFYAGVGSREPPVETLVEMRRLASDLGLAGWRLRTGGADGADTAFEHGHRDAKDDRGLEVFLP